MVEVIEPLNVSGESVVLLGRQHHLNRLVALKVMPAGKSRERLLAVLEHEHIVRVFSETLDFREARRLVCMQYVPGPDLGKLLPVLADRDRKSLTGVDLLGLIDAFARQAPIFQGTLAKNRTEFSHLSFDEAVAQWGQQLAEALRHAHSQGMAHLNIKPENILLSPYGRAYLSDFGVLKRRPSEEDWRNDLHALKQVLFRLAGKTPAPVRPRPSYFTLNLEGILGDEAPVTSPEALRDRLIGFNELKKVEQALPRPGPMMRFTLAYPFVALISFRVLPHLVGTAFGAIYCFFRRGATLTGDEKAKLMTLVRAYNSISYPSGIILTILIALGVIRAFRRRALLPVANGAEAAELRRQTLLLPMKLAAVNCLTWWPSIGVLGVGAYWITGRLNWIGYVHFTTAVLLSWLIATSYSTLYCLFFSVQALYPRFLEPEPGIREAARRELQCTRRVLRWLPATLVLVPLSLALLLTQAGPGEFTPEKFLWFRGVLAFLIAAGGVGFVVSMFGLHRLGAVTRALSE